MFQVFRIIVVLVAGAGGIATSQLPEFAQQYRQRLGGALDEVRTIVASFDADARRSGLSRQEAVSALKADDDTLVRDRGASIAEVLDRHDALERQHRALDAAPPPLRPVHVLRYPDPRVMQGAWQDFNPAVPVTWAGFAWAAVGVLLGALIAIVGRGAARRLAGSGSRAGRPVDTES